MVDIKLRFFQRTYTAHTRINGKNYHVKADIGAANKLAALLKNLGIRDQPCRVFNPTGNVALCLKSLHDWATWDYQEEKHKYHQQLAEASKREAATY